MTDVSLMFPHIWLGLFPRMKLSNSYRLRTRNELIQKAMLEHLRIFNPSYPTPYIIAIPIITQYGFCTSLQFSCEFILQHSSHLLVVFEYTQ